MDALTGLVLLVALTAFGWYVVKPVLLGSAKLGCALALGIIGLFVIVMITLIIAEL